MGEMSFDFPPDLRRLIEARVEAGHYAGPADYVRDLIRRADESDQGVTVAAGDSPEYIAWVREKVAEGLASGFIKRDARDVLREIIAERHARSG